MESQQESRLLFVPGKRMCRFFYKRFFNFKLSGDFDQKTIKFIDDCVAKDFCRLSMGLERVYYCRGKGVLT